MSSHQFPSATFGEPIIITSVLTVLRLLQRRLTGPALLFLFGVLTGVAQDQIANTTPWIGERAIVRTSAELTTQSSNSPACATFDFEFDLPLKAVDVSSVGSPGGSDPLVPSLTAAPQTLGISFTGATLFDTHAFPPDSMGTVGPTQFIVAVNGRIRSFNKSTGVADGAIDVDTDTFFNSVMTPPATNNFTSDPRIRFDRLSNRWFIIMIDVPGQSGVLPNRVMIAVSSGSVVTPSSTWSFFYFQQDLVSPNGDSGNFADYPTLGIDANALYIGVNIFSTRGSGAFSNTTGFVVRKSSLLSGGPIVVTAFRKLISKFSGQGPYTPQGVDNYDPNATEGYFIGIDASSDGLLDLRRVSNPGGTPTISGNITLSIPMTSQPLTVPHLGNTGGANGNLDGLDNRLICAHFRNGSLWTCHNIAVDNTGSPTGAVTRDAVRWYQLQGIPTGQTPFIAQSGTVFQSSASNTTDQRNYWMGSIMVSGQGHVAMGFSAAGANEHINAATCGRLANDSLGTMQAPTLYTSSGTSYNPSGDSGGTGGRRWGDFSYTSLDPSDDMTMWTIQEFCDSTDSYGVRVVRLLAPPPAMPTNCSPNSAPAGATNISIQITGQIANGAGYFDPGPGFSNRIAAAFNGGGVTVNGVSFADPAHITASISIAPNASIGARTLTITNPDGQVVTSSALFSITAPSNHPPVLSAIANQTVNEGILLTVQAFATDPDSGQTLTFSLAAGVPTNAVINATNGTLTWTPGEGDGPGTNLITVRVADNGLPPLTNTTTFTVIVNEVNTAPVLATIPVHFLHAGNTLVFTNSASDIDLPPNTLTFSLGTNAPASMQIDSNTGIVSWTPNDTFVGTTNTFSVRVMDNGVPPLSDSKIATVVVLARPAFQPATIVSNAVVLVWSAIPGRSYRVQYKNDLNDVAWTDLIGDVTASTTTASKSDAIGANRRFYRIVAL